MPDTLQTLVKDYGIVRRCQVGIVDRAHSTTFTEEQFSKAIDRLRPARPAPAERDERARPSVACFAGNNDDALALRKAHQIVKNGATMTLVPTYVGAEQGNRRQRCNRRTRTTPWP